MNINTSLSELNTYNVYVTNLVPDIYKYTDDFDDNTGDLNKTIYAIAEQADGKILVGGLSDIGLIRLNSDGSTDGTFTPAISGNVYSIVVQSDGKIYVGGGFTFSSTNNIVRLNSDGTEDTSFNVGSGFNGEVSEMKLSSDESFLIVSGYFYEYDGNPSNRIAKLSTTNGNLNATFQTNVAASVTGNFITSFDMINSDDIFLIDELTLKKIDFDGLLDVSFTQSTFSYNVQKLKIGSDNMIVCGGDFNAITIEAVVKDIKRLAKFNIDGTLDETFSVDLVYRDGLGFVNSFDLDSSNNIYIGGNITSINNNNCHFFAKITSKGVFATFNDPFDFEEEPRSVLVSSNGSVFVGGEFNKPNYKIAKFNQDGSLVKSFVLEYSGEWFGISDGGEDLEDGGNFINTNLTQLYADITNDNVNATDSIPNTHVPAWNDVSYDNFNIFGYEYNPTNPNGVVADGTSYFGAGSSYFTNMYPGMFCLVANNINIEEFSVTGNSGADGTGEVRATSFEINVKGQTYSCFLKSIYDNSDPSMNQLIIVDGKLDGLTQLYNNTSSYDDHCVQGLTGRNMVGYMLLCRGKDVGSGSFGDPLDYGNAQQIALMFVTILNGFQNDYLLNFDPENKATEDSDGNLDTAILNGKSIQRSGYIETVNIISQRKVSAKMDGETINDKPQTIADVLGIVEL